MTGQALAGPNLCKVKSCLFTEPCWQTLNEHHNKFTAGWELDLSKRNHSGVCLVLKLLGNAIQAPSKCSL